MLTSTRSIFPASAGCRSRVPHSASRHGGGPCERARSSRRHSAVLVGHSMGAQWVVELAASRPDLAAGVVLIGPVADDAHRTASAQAAALAWDTMGESLGANAVVLLDYLRCGPVWFLTQLRHMIAYPIEDRVPEILAPLLVIRGGNDPIAGTEWCRKLRSRAPNGSFVKVPGHRHVVQFTAAPAVASASVRSSHQLSGLLSRSGPWARPPYPEPMVVAQSAPPVNPWERSVPWCDRVK